MLFSYSAVRSKRPKVLNYAVVAIVGAIISLSNPSMLSAQTTVDATRGAPITPLPLSTNPEHAAAPTLTATHITRAISIDGKLNESDWATAVPGKTFTETEPVDGDPASEATDVRILYDDDAIYVGARLENKHSKISSRLGRRDTDLSDSDWFIVVFDSYHDHNGGYRFKVNPVGVYGDEANGDRSWNPVWTVATTQDADGWSAEMRIPFSQLRFSPAADQVWGLQFYREIKATAEKLVYSYSPKSVRGGPSRFGHLLGIKDVKRGKTLEVLPYVAGRADLKEIPRAANVNFANPYRTGRDLSEQYGADIKYRVTSNFTIDATVNPDFGQIEADEQQVNLSANEQFFREQRPFFVEGSNAFRFGSGGGDMSQLFYSRRIGRSPQGSVPSRSRYSDKPSQSAIAGAAKLTGRTPKGWLIGISEAVTSREEAPWVDSAAKRFRTEVEPRSNYFAARVKKEMSEGQSSIGGILTMVHRDLGDSLLATRLRSSAYVSGVDFGHSFANRTWELSGNVVASYVNGTSAVLTSAQRSSVRFYQRPDADYLEVDSSATHLAGWTGALGLKKSSGTHWTGEVNASAVSPGYEINDLGFQNNADRATVSGGVNYDQRVAGKHIRNWGVGVRPEFRTNFGGDVTSRALRADMEGQLLNFIGGKINLSHEFSSLDDRLTRGGPLAASVPANNVSVNLNGDSRKAYTWNISASERWDESGAWGQSRNIKFGFRPASWWSGEIGPKLSRSRGTAQYLTSVSDPLATATYGRRYIFAGIRQTTLSLQTRLNMTMSPQLGFSLVAEPFIASGEYSGPRELRAARTFEFNDYGVDVGTMRRNDDTRRFEIDPDGAGPAQAFTVADNSFNTRSMNATANLRWDWRSGSTLFLVWQHRRSNPANYGRFDLNRDFHEIFGKRAENTLMFKVNYWFNP